MRPRSLVLAGGTLLALLASCSCSRSSADPERGNSSPSRTFAAREPDAPIENYARITPALGRGAQPDERGLEYLAQHGYRTVVNLRMNHSERAEVQALGMQCVEIPLHADLFGSTAPTEEEVRRFFAVVLD